MTTLYNDYFGFPTFRYVPAPATIIEGALISLSAGGLGAAGAVMRALRLPPAEAMRPEPPARHVIGWLDRLVPRRLTPPPVKMILRNLQRQPVRAGLSALGVAFAVAMLIVGMFSLDAIEVLLDMQFNVAQRQDYTVTFVEPRSARALHELAHLPGVLAVEPVRMVPARLRAGHRTREEIITGLDERSRLQRVVDTSHASIPLPRGWPRAVGSSLPKCWASRRATDLQVELLEGYRPVRTVNIAAIVDEYMGTSVYMEIAASAAFYERGPDDVGGGHPHRQGRFTRSVPPPQGDTGRRGRQLQARGN